MSIIAYFCRHVNTTRHLARFRPVTWRIFDQPLGAFFLGILTHLRRAAARLRAARLRPSCHREANPALRTSAAARIQRTRLQDTHARQRSQRQCCHRDSAHQPSQPPSSRNRYVNHPQKIPRRKWEEPILLCEDAAKCANREKCAMHKTAVFGIITGIER